jgi:hypothetical protein
MDKEQAKVYRRMPISFGPHPSPRQDVHGRDQESSHSNFVTATVKFKTSRTLLQNLLPTSAYTFVAPDDFAYASYSVTTLDNMDWLGGKGYNYCGFYLHGVQYKKTDGSVLNGDYLAVMWENLTDPILTGREEVGFPKLYSEIDIERTPSTWKMRSSWQDATYLTLELGDLEACQIPDQPSNDGVFLYKYIPATGKRGFADAEYPICAPPNLGSNVKTFQSTPNCSIKVDPNDDRALPTLHHIVSRLAELPIYEIVGRSVAEGTGVDDVAAAYRIE